MKTSEEQKSDKKLFPPHICIYIYKWGKYYRQLMYTLTTRHPRLASPFWVEELWRFGSWIHIACSRDIFLNSIDTEVLGIFDVNTWTELPSEDLTCHRQNIVLGMSVISLLRCALYGGGSLSSVAGLHPANRACCLSRRLFYWTTHSLRVWNVSALLFFFLFRYMLYNYRQIDLALMYIWFEL